MLQSPGRIARAGCESSVVINSTYSTSGIRSVNPRKDKSASSRPTWVVPRAEAIKIAVLYGCKLDVDSSPGTLRQTPHRGKSSPAWDHGSTAVQQRVRDQTTAAPDRLLRNRALDQIKVRKDRIEAALPATRRIGWGRFPNVSKGRLPKRRFRVESRRCGDDRTRDGKGERVDQWRGEQRPGHLESRM